MFLKYYKALIGLVALLVLFLVIRGCQQPASIITKPLPTEDVLHVAVEHNVISVQTDKETTSQYVPADGRVDVTVDKEGVVTLDVKNKGFTLRPVIGPFVSDRLSLAGGVQFAYWNRWEAYAGLKYPVLAAFVGGGYRLDQLYMPNTSVAMAYTTRKEIGVSLLFRF